MNIYTSQKVFCIYIQAKQNIPISEKDHNALKNFGLYEDEKSTLKEQDIKGDYINLVSKSSDTRSCIKDGLSRHISQDGLLASELSSFLREVRFSE